MTAIATAAAAMVKKSFEKRSFWLNLSPRNACKSSYTKQLCILIPLRKFPAISNILLDK
jgi:hypothetical protein